MLRMLRMLLRVLTYATAQVLSEQGDAVRMLTYATYATYAATYADVCYGAGALGARRCRVGGAAQGLLPEQHRRPQLQPLSRALQVRQSADVC
jgi:hypothetical protein